VEGSEEADADDEAEGEAESDGEGESDGSANAVAAPQTPPSRTMRSMVAIAFHEPFRPVFMIGHRRPPAGAATRA